MILIIANILSLIGNILFTSSSILKSKKKILIFQSSNYILAIISEIMTAAYSASVQEAISLLRNIIILFVKTKSKIVKLIITISCVVVAVVLGVIINIVFSNNVWYGYLPIFGTIIYSTGIILAFMLNISEIKSEFIIKVALIFNCILWATYGIFVRLYPITIFNCVTITLSIISIIRIIIILRKAKKNNDTNIESL